MLWTAGLQGNIKKGGIHFWLVLIFPFWRFETRNDGDVWGSDSLGVPFVSCLYVRKQNPTRREKEEDDERKTDPTESAGEGGSREPGVVDKEEEYSSNILKT